MRGMLRHLNDPHFVEQLMTWEHWKGVLEVGAVVALFFVLVYWHIARSKPDAVLKRLGKSR